MKSSDSFLAVLVVLAGDKDDALDLANGAPFIPDAVTLARRNGRKLSYQRVDGDFHGGIWRDDDSGVIVAAHDHLGSITVSGMEAK